MKSTDIPDTDESLAIPGCLGCARLLVEVHELRELVMKLQAQLNQNSSNSSKPPSSDPPGTSPPPAKEKSGRKPGGQPGHEGRCRERLPRERITRIVHHVPQHCEACGIKLPQVPEPSDPPGHEPSWHQVTEVPPFAAEVTEHQGHACACEACGHITRSEIPPEIRAHTIGPNLASILSFFSGRCHESKRTIQEVAESLFGVQISLGTISNLKRDFQKLIDSGNDASIKLGRTGLKVVKEIFEIWHDFKAEKFGRRALRNRMIPAQERLERALIRGRDGPDPATARFSRRILKIFAALWTFIAHEDVEPTNNHAERMLRPAVLWRKRSFGNHSEDGCRFTERMLTTVQTLRLQHRPVLSYLRDAVAAHRCQSPPPPLIVASWDG